MKKILSAAVFMLCILCTGCSRPSAPPEPPKCRVVTLVEIHAENVAEPGQRRYADPGKMTKALNCLRRLELWDPPQEAPDLDGTPLYRITLTFSDGSTKHYDQVGHSHLRVNDGPWMEISGGRGWRIALLLAAVPSDAIE